MYKTYSLKLELFRDMACVLYVANDVEELQGDEALGTIKFSSIYDDFCFELKTDEGDVVGFIMVVVTDMDQGDVARQAYIMSNMMLRLANISQHKETEDVYSYVLRYLINQINESLEDFKNEEKNKPKRRSGRSQKTSAADNVVGFGGTRTQIGFKKEETE